MVMKALIATMVILIALMFYLMIEEATFDYTTCDASDQWRDRHTAMWVQHMKVGDVTTFITHPARDWTERLYHCPKNDRWREETH